MKLENLDKLYVHELKDLYSAEKQILQALQKMAGAASSPRLIEAFEGHLKQTKEHVRRIESIFKSLDYKAGGEHCAGAEGLIKEGESLMEIEATDEVRDAALICAAQRVEHYEIAGYGCAVALALAIGRDEDVKMLRATLEEEGKTDRDLTHLAEKEILFRANVA